MHVTYQKSCAVLFSSIGYYSTLIFLSPPHLFYSKIDQPPIQFKNPPPGHFALPHRVVSIPEKYFPLILTLVKLPEQSQYGRLAEDRNHIFLYIHYKP
jgi:hypothetical protein